jgi:hypothetical protein
MFVYNDDYNKVISTASEIRNFYKINKKYLTQNKNDSYWKFWIELLEFFNNHDDTSLLNMYKNDVSNWNTAVLYVNMYINADLADNIEVMPTQQNIKGYFQQENLYYILLVLIIIVIVLFLLYKYSKKKGYKLMVK